jgi:hypothetical protein
MIRAFFRGGQDSFVFDYLEFDETGGLRAGYRYFARARKFFRVIIPNDAYLCARAAAGTPGKPRCFPVVRISSRCARGSRFVAHERCISPAASPSDDLH